MSARERILERIRRAQGRPRALSAAESEEIETRLARRPRGPLRPLPAEPLAAFLDAAHAAACTSERVASEAEAPAAVARYLAAHGVAPVGCVWPALAALAWTQAGLQLEARAARATDAVGVTGCFCAVAETGTLVLLSSPATPASVSLLPETHVALVPLARLVPHLEDAWTLVRAEAGRLPRAVNLVSGPSRTADIEQTIVLGAHGPARVHLVLVG